MRKYSKNHKDVEYFVPGRKKSVAGSTICTRDALIFVHNENPSLTIKQLRKLLTDTIAPDCVEILDAYIKLGYGDYIPDWTY